MWTVLAFISALCLGFYDISKKVALRDNKVIDVVTLSVCISALILSVPLILSRLYPEILLGTAFFVPEMDAQAHYFIFLKSVIVLSSWVFAYISLKHLPLSVVSPMQATRPMWTLVGALLIFGERLNTWQWLGVCLAIGTVLVFSLSAAFKSSGSTSPANLPSFKGGAGGRFINPYYIALALAILIGACSGLYDKYLMRRYDHNAVQVYYTFYQATLMLLFWIADYKLNRASTSSPRPVVKNLGVIALISVFLIISDNVYMLALRDPDSLIAVVSTIRRGGAVIGFAYGLIFLKEHDPLRKLLCMLGIMAGLLCLAIGSL